MSYRERGSQFFLGVDFDRRLPLASGRVTCLGKDLEGAADGLNVEPLQRKERELLEGGQQQQQHARQRQQKG